MVSSKKILVTGAAGFIGFHLARALKLRGDQVLGYDNFNDYYSPQLKRDRASILKQEKITIIDGDICDVTLLQKAIQEFQPTHIVHLAGMAGVRYSLKNPQAYVKANIEGFVNILEACRNVHAKFIYASSSSVYGRNEETPFSIHDRTDHQTCLYGVSKKTNELIADSYHYLYGIPVTGLRFFTVYGPWGRPDMAYFFFTKAIIEGTEIDIFNHGKVRRDFTFIDDIVQGTMAAIDLGAPCALFNLGNHQSVEVLEFVSILEQAIGKPAKKRFLPMQPGDMLATYADIKESTHQLGFIPKTSLAQGLPIFVKWYREYFK